MTQRTMIVAHQTMNHNIFTRMKRTHTHNGDDRRYTQAWAPAERTAAGGDYAHTQQATTGMERSGMDQNITCAYKGCAKAQSPPGPRPLSCGGKGWYVPSGMCWYIDAMGHERPSCHTGGTDRNHHPPSARCAGPRHSRPKQQRTNHLAHPVDRILFLIVLL